MYNYGGPCITMEGYVWLWRATYSCGGPCTYITFYIFFLFGVLYIVHRHSCGRPCITLRGVGGGAMYNCEAPCVTMKGHV